MALDRKRIATAIRERRKELGYTRDRVLDIVSPEFLSRHTLERIENADGTVSAAKIRLVMEALQMRPADHMDADSIFDSSINSPELEKRLDAERVLFPADSLPLAYPIRNLADLIAFYPLLSLDQIANVTEHITGEVPGFESYIFSKLQELPDPRHPQGTTPYFSGPKIRHAAAGRNGTVTQRIRSQNTPKKWTWHFRTTTTRYRRFAINSGVRRCIRGQMWKERRNRRICGKGTRHSGPSDCAETSPGSISVSRFWNIFLSGAE